MATDKDELKDALEEFDLCVESEAENRANALENLRFAKMGEQWPEEVRKQRELEGRPCLRINKMPAFIRQVVNDGRQNKPAIKVHPADDEADPATAEVMSGLIRNIETTSDAEVAYDTGLDFAVTCGVGYWRVTAEYAHDDTFDQDLKIKAVPNMFSVYGDPYSQAADSADWNRAFVTELLPKRVFESKYKGADKVDWNMGDYANLRANWTDGEQILVAERWTRSEVRKKILKLSDGRIVKEDWYLEEVPGLSGYANKDLLDALGITVVADRETMSWKVKQQIMSGAEVLETNDWRGIYIPIVPVYGDIVNIEGKRYFRSLIDDAKDPQRMFNYWRPLALDTPIPTPSGWTTMGAIKVGDEVLTEVGTSARVIGESPIHLRRECYRVTFDDGTAIVADAEHPWPVEERAGRKMAGFTWVERLARTDELTPGKHFIKTPAPLDLNDADLPIHPYVLGVWLGDGSSDSGTICQATGDIEELRGLVDDCGYQASIARHYPDRVSVFTAYGLRSQLRASGLLWNKHIPPAYLRASLQQREALLQGLMDTDGSIDGKGQCSFTTTIPELAAGFAELLRTLGIKAKACKRVGRVRLWADGRPASSHADAYQFSFTPSRRDTVFRLTRKLAVQKRERKEHLRRAKRYAIRSVERVASVPVKCIAIDAPSHLFLAGEGMVPTHNTTSTELVALAPKAPWVGPVGSFNSDSDKWATANTETHQYLEYDPVIENGAIMPPPQRQPFAGVPAGALHEAMNASDDMKAVTGIYDASLGARSNETSGRAILARQREGDVSTFHFMDNQSRAIRHTGRILIDLIPHYYNSERIIRVLGPDKKPRAVPINQPVIGPDGQPQMRPDGKQLIYNLAIGKYDLTVETGPSFTTKREEAAYQMTEFIRAFPQAAPLIGDMLAKNMDWPEADEIARRLQAMLPPQIQGQNPQVQQLQQQIQQMAQNLSKLGQELQQEKAGKELEVRKLDIDAYGKETDRLKVLGGGMTPEMVQAMVLQTIQQVMQSPDVLPPAHPQMQPQAPMATQLPQQGMHQMPDGSMMQNAAMPQMQQPPNPMMSQPQPGQEPGFLLPGQGQ